MNLLKIKKRIINLNSVYKIVNVLFLTSLIKLKKYKKELLENSDFDMLINDILEKNYKRNNYLINNQNDQLFIVITSNIGFCGNYNKEIVDYIDKNIKRDSNILIIGTNGFNLLKKLKYNFFNKFVSCDNDFLSLSKDIFFFATENKFQKINIIFLKNSNLTSNIICNEQIFPINFIIDDNKINLAIIEPNKKELIKKMTNFYAINNIYKAILTAKITEQTIRISTMQKAEKNTKEIINNLKNKYNKLRHLKITQEILENSSTREV